MKMHAKEILKNKADKMVDLIIDEIGSEGEKKLSASFVDSKTKTKYIISLKIESGSPDTLKEVVADDEVTDKIEDILTRLVALEIKEDSDTVYDDSQIQLRLEELEDDYHGLKARVVILENNAAQLDGQPNQEED